MHFLAVAQVPTMKHVGSCVTQMSPENRLGNKIVTMKKVTFISKVNGPVGCASSGKSNASSLASTLTQTKGDADKQEKVMRWN
jgi:hypothetical protein